MNAVPRTEVEAERIDAALTEVLERPEFQEPEPNFLTELAGDFIEWLGGLFSSEEAGAVGKAGMDALLILLAALGLLALALLLVEVARSRARGARPDIPLLAPEEVAHRVEELRREARAAESVGDWIRALRLYFFATVVGLGERGDLDYRDAWTNRELFERGSPSPETRELLGPLVTELDRHSFGRRPTDAARVRVFSEACDQLLLRSSG